MGKLPRHVPEPHNNNSHGRMVYLLTPRKINILNPQNGDLVQMIVLSGEYINQGSLDYQFGGNQTMQIDGNSEGFPLKSALFGLVI